MGIIHLIKEIREPEFGYYILFCGMKYQDSDNVNMTKDVKKATCKSCLEM